MEFVYTATFEQHFTGSEKPRGYRLPFFFALLEDAHLAAFDHRAEVNETEHCMANAEYVLRRYPIPQHAHKLPERKGADRQWVMCGDSTLSPDFARVLREVLPTPDALHVVKQGFSKE